MKVKGEWEQDADTRARHQAEWEQDADTRARHQAEWEQDADTRARHQGPAEGHQVAGHSLGCRAGYSTTTQSADRQLY